MSETVAFVTEFCPPYRTGFFERFAERFDTKFFFCDHRDKWEAYGEFDYETLSGVRFRDRYNVAYPVFWKLYQHDPDVVVGGPVEGFGGHASYLYAKLTRTPFVLWTGEWHLPLTTFRTATFPLIRRIYDGADAIAVYGPHIRDYLTDLGVDAEKIDIAWNTVDTSKFRDVSPERTAELREEWDIPAKANVVLYVGRLVKEKGVEYLCEGFESASEELETASDESETATHLLVVGDGDRREELQAQTEDAENVTFTGYVDNDDLAEYYDLADVFVLPSLTTDVFKEPWGLVLNEAMSAGTAVIASSSVGAARAGLVQDGTNGYVVPERNAGAIADRLVSILGDEERANEMANRSRDLIAEYDYDRMVDGFEEAIDVATDEGSD